MAEPTSPISMSRTNMFSMTPPRRALLLKRIPRGDHHSPATLSRTISDGLANRFGCFGHAIRLRTETGDDTVAGGERGGLDRGQNGRKAVPGVGGLFLSAGGRVEG